MSKEKIIKDPFLKIIFSPMMVVIISLLLIWIQSTFPISPYYNEANPLELVSFYWLYAGVTHVSWVIKQWFLSIKNSKCTNVT